MTGTYMLMTALPGGAMTNLYLVAFPLTVNEQLTTPMRMVVSVCAAMG